MTRPPAPTSEGPLRIAPHGEPAITLLPSQDAIDAGEIIFQVVDPEGGLRLAITADGVVRARAIDTG